MRLLGADAPATGGSNARSTGRPAAADLQHNRLAELLLRMWRRFGHRTDPGRRQRRRRVAFTPGHRLIECEVGEAALLPPVSSTRQKRG